MLSGHFDETILSDYKKMKFIIDVIGKVRYIDMGSDDIEKVAQLQFSESRKKTEPKGSEMTFAPQGAKLE